MSAESPDYRGAAEEFLADASSVDALTQLAVRSAESVWRLARELGPIGRLSPGDVEFFGSHLIEIRELHGEWRALAPAEGWDALFRAVFYAIELRAGDQPTITVWGDERRGGYRIALSLVRRVLTAGPFLDMAVPLDPDEIEGRLGLICRLGPLPTVATLHDRILFERRGLERWLESHGRALKAARSGGRDAAAPGEIADLLEFLGATGDEEWPARQFLLGGGVGGVVYDLSSFSHAVRDGRVTARPGLRTNGRTPPCLYVVREVLEGMPGYVGALRKAMARRP